MLRLTFRLWIMTTMIQVASLLFFYFFCAFCEVFFLATVKKDNESGSDYGYLQQVFFPLLSKTQLYAVYLYLHKAKRGFTFHCLYCSKMAAELFSLLPYPVSIRLSLVWHVKTSCHGGSEDRWQEEMCSHIGLSLSPSCLRRPLQRASFTAGWSIMLASHTWAVLIFLGLWRWASCQ